VLNTPLAGPPTRLSTSNASVCAHTLLECGFGACPDNPVAYELIKPHREPGDHSHSMVPGGFDVMS
jgi:hypothetical protein